jgi:alkylated DNA nucleotide flippase Atl1
MKKKTASQTKWQGKLADDHGLPRVAKITGRMSKRWGTGTVAIPAPREIDALMKKVPRGKVTTINEMRTKVARDHHATIGCPITTGIFAWIAANAAEERRAAGKKNITPYWRTLKSGGEVNPKYPGGIARQKKLLSGEGHRVVKKGKRTIVTDWAENLKKFA